MLTQAEAAEQVLDPVKFQSVFLKRKLWDVQRRIATSAHTKRSTSVKGCHASGKTYVSSGAILHHLARYKSGKVLTVAPTERQVKIIWEEVEIARRTSAISFPECSVLGLRISEERYGLGFSSAHGVNAQGFHGDDVLIVVDEAPGVSGEVYDAIEGIRAGGRVRLLRLGNPTISSGPFFDDFTRGRGMSECITISAFDTPNLFNQKAKRPLTIEELLELTDEELEYAPVPYLVTRQWVKEKFLKWGPTNPRYVSRVLGEFPTQSEHSVFSLEWIEKAKRQPTQQELDRIAGHYIQVGIDVAGPGDDEAAACARIGGVVVARESWADADPRGKVVNWLGGLRTRRGNPLGPVVVDIIGIGYNFALHLVDQGFQVYGFNAGHAAQEPLKFLNRKAEECFRLRDWYKDGAISHMPEALDEETEAQLSGLLYEETPRGLIKIESKQDARKRGVASPDRAEAEIMAFSYVVPAEVRVNRDVVEISAI